MYTSKISFEDHVREAVGKCVRWWLNPHDVTGIDVALRAAAAHRRSAITHQSLSPSVCVLKSPWARSWIPDVVSLPCWAWTMAWLIYEAIKLWFKQFINLEKINKQLFTASQSQWLICFSSFSEKSFFSLLSDKVRYSKTSLCSDMHL